MEYEGAQINCTQPQSDITATSLDLDGESIDITQMSCSQLLQQMMAANSNTWDANDELSFIMMDLPINSYATLITAPGNFQVQKSIYNTFIHVVYNYNRGAKVIISLFYVEQYDHINKQGK
jgi:hypothetical protein